MYTIAEAARRAGVSAPLLRAWERRYGIVAPERTTHGYRLYGDEDIARLRATRALVDDGWSPSAAAARILADGIPPEAAATEAPPARDDALVDAFLAAAARFDQPGLGRVLDEMFARGTFERVMADLVDPALVALGEAWADGRIGVAAEHAASHMVLRRLAAAYEAAGAPSAASGRVLVGLPPGSRHELGALAFATAARRAGLAVLYLGPDLPVDDWVRAAGAPRDRDRARAAVIGVVSASDRPAADAVADALRTARPDLVVAVGGAAALARAGVTRLPDPLPEAVAV
ncbi:MAG TPA: MerR family transcriptional regulator, partial [Candidatus Limnocylindrales bacterium]|nr:MerR family transcriptional regulator [Candidatus Limnocylindrales bacterium]